MKSTFLIFLFIFSVQVLSGQKDIPLPGLVVEQNSKYRTGHIIYIPNAEIKSKGAMPQRSDANGRFTLVFADRPGGDVVRISAAKSGYEIVNEEDLIQASVIGRLQPLKIVMCVAGQLYENQITYYNIAKNASFAAYERKIAILKIEGKEKERLMSELRVQFNQNIKTKEEAINLLDKQRQLAEKQAKELADKWVTVNLDDESPTYQRAFAAFEAKNIELAKGILDSVDLEKRLAMNSKEKAKEEALRGTLQKNIEKRNEEIRQDVNMCLFMARLHKLEGEWIQAEKLYDLAVQYDKSNFEVTFEAAHFMQIQNQFAKARIYYEKAFSQSNIPDEKSLILNNLGNLLQVTNEMSEAKKTYEEALKIRRKLAEENPHVYLPYVATTLNNLGILLKVNNDMSGAKKAYEEALEIRRELAEKSPIYLADVATSLNNLGELLKEINDISAAKQALEEALQIRRKLAEKNPNIYLSYVAGSLNNWAELLWADKSMDGAKQALDEALEIQKKLAEKNPDVYLPDVAITLNNLGILLSNENDKSEAGRAFEEALQTYRNLAEKNPNVYLPHVAATLKNLGAFLNVSNSRKGAKQVYEEALQKYRKLAEKNPDAYLPDVAATLNSLGELVWANSDMNEAKNAFEEGLQIYRKLADKKPETYNMVVAMTSINIGFFYEQLLNTTGDMSLKKIGLDLIKDVQARLTIFPNEHTQVQQFLPFVDRLMRFFEDFDESSFRLNQELEQIAPLEEKNKEEKDPHQKVLQQEEILRILFGIEKNLPGNAKIKNFIAYNYGSLAWYQLFDRQFTEAEYSAYSGLKKAPSEEWINCTLVLALLYQGKWEAAKQIYISMKDKKYGDETYKKAFLEDLDALEKEDITHPDVAKARHLLQNK